MGNFPIIISHVNNSYIGAEESDRFLEQNWEK